MTLNDLAKKLSPAQRNAVLWLPEDGSEKEYCNGLGAKQKVSRTSLYCLTNFTIGDPTKGVAVCCKMVRQIHNKGSKDSGQIWPNDLWALNPSGVAIRKIVNEMQRAKSANGETSGENS